LNGIPPRSRCMFGLQRLGPTLSSEHRAHLDERQKPLLL